MASITDDLQPRRLARSANALPIVLVGGLGALDFIWNSFVQLQWTPSFLFLATPAYMCFALFVIFKIVWPNEIALELLLYLGLWTLFPIFGSQLSYLAATVDFPLRDQMFMRADSSLGFNWLLWFNFVWAHPQISKVLYYAYESYLIQPFILVFLFALARVRDRNRDFLVATIIALLLVIAISAILPAYGPPKEYGVPTGWDDALGELRRGAHLPFGYVGIVTFPSFHACVAVLFALSMRGHLLGFVTAVMLNALMIVSTAPLGGHYLVDLIAGCAIAALSFRLATLFPRSQRLA